MKRHIAFIVAAIMLITSGMSALVFAADSNLLFSCSDASGYKSFVRSSLAQVYGVGGRDAADASARIEPNVAEREGDTVYTGYTDYNVGTVTGGNWSCAGRKGYLVIEGSFMPTNGAKFRIATSGSATFSTDISAVQDRWNKFVVIYDFEDGKSYTESNGVRGNAQKTNFGTVRNASAGTYYQAVRPVVTTNAGSGAAIYLDDYKIYFSDSMPEISSAPKLDETKFKTKGAFVEAVGKKVSDITCANAQVRVFADNSFTKRLEDDGIIAEDNVIVLQSSDGSFAYYTVVSEFGREPATAYAMYDDSSTLGKMPMLRMTSSVEYGVGGKSALDAVGKFTATELTADNSYTFFTNNSIDTSLKNDKVTVSISVYPNETVSGIFFATNGHAPISKTISTALLKADSWNKLAIVYDPSTQSSALYVNEVYQSTTKHALGTILRIVFNVCTEDFADGYIYYDDMAIYAGEVFYPAVTFGKYTCDAVSLHGYGSDTVGMIKQEAVLAQKAYTISVYSENGVQKADSETILGSDDIRIYDGDTLISHYSLGCATFAAMDDCKILSDGYVSESGKYGSGNIELSRTVASYDKSRNVIAAAALYGANGELKQLSLTPQIVNGVTEVKANIALSETNGTSLKLIIIGAETLLPLCEAAVFAPYPIDKIEVAAPLYEGYTAKSAVFNYDDCVPSDIRMVELLNKYNMKGTFNLLGKNVLGKMRSECLKKTGKDDDASVFEFVKGVYNGHEISSHTFNHYPAHLNPGEVGQDSGGNKLVGASTEDEVNDITSCVAYLEENLGADDVIGLAWPNAFGTARNDYETDLLPAMKQCGIKYARGKSNGKFSLPDDWYVWNSTCHHNNAPENANVFAALPNSGDLKCFFCWGHSYEFDNNADNNDYNWNMIEGVMQTLAQDNIWFATNGDIYRYAEAVKKAVISETSVENKSDMTLYFNINGKNVEIAPGESYEL